MESAQAKIRYIFVSCITSIEEHIVPCYISGIGDDAKFQDISKGWFLYLEGSHEALHVGMEKPELVKGDRVKITLEKV